MRIGLKPVVALVAALTVAGCGGSESGEGGGGGGGGGATFGDEVTVTASDERVAHGLQAGRYRLNWRAPDCDSRQLLITPAAGGEPFYDNPRPTLPILFVNGLPAGEFFIEVIGEGCDEWEISMVKV